MNTFPGLVHTARHVMRVRLTYDACPLAVAAAALGADGFHDVTGGVYKARERIHGAVADAPLLAIPASCRRIAADNPN